MKKNFYLICLAIVIVLNMCLWSCADLLVDNENEPDQEEALGVPEDVEALIGSSFKSCWDATHITGWGLTIQTISDALSVSWSFLGMQDNSSEPRVEWDNSPAYTHAYQLEAPWYGWYSANSAASDGVAAIKNGVNIGEKDDVGNYPANKRAEAFARFVQGLSHGSIGILFDQAFIVDETTDLTQPLTLRPYSDVINAAIGYLEDCISICESNTFSIPYDWIHIENLSHVELAKICQSFIARLLACKARTPDDRTNAPWAEILSHIDAGITEQFAPDAESFSWYSLHMYFTGRLSMYGRADYKMIGPADTSGAYQNWLAKPVEDRTVFVVETNDKRITEGIDTTGSQLPGLYFKNEYRTRLLSSSGTYHQSYYWANKRYDYATSFTGPMPDMPMSEMYLLKAEGALNLGDNAIAAEYINMTRVDIGGLNPTTASHSTGSINDDPSALDNASLWSMLKYEKIIEGVLTNPYVPYADRRGYGDLVAGTPTHYPIPGKELEVLMMANYTFGGVENSGLLGTAP